MHPPSWLTGALPLFARPGHDFCGISYRAAWRRAQRHECMRDRSPAGGMRAPPRLAPSPERPTPGLTPSRRLAPAVGGRRQDEIGRRDGPDLDLHVDPVEQRPGDARAVLGEAALIGLAAAGIARIIAVAAAARVHGGDELETRRIDVAVIGAA